jgi:membrane protease YdiL (CAAX protease family)
VIALLLLIATYNLVLSLWLPSWATLPANLVVAALAVVIARHTGATWGELGLDPEFAGRGLRVGALATLAIVVALSVGLVVPSIRALLTDERAASDTIQRALFDSTLRIPFGTVLLEEVLFRGALLGVALRRYSIGSAVTLSSVLFGLWHVLPGLEFADTDAARAFISEQRDIVAAAGGVLVTSAAGYVLCWLRLRSESLVAPYVTHVGLNVAAYWAARIAVSLGG